MPSNYTNAAGVEFYWDPVTNSYVKAPGQEKYPKGDPRNFGGQSSPSAPPPEQESQYDIVADANREAGRGYRDVGEQAASEMGGVLASGLGQFSDVDRRTRDLYGLGGELSGPGRDEELFEQHKSGLLDETEIEKLYASRLAGGDPFVERLREQAKRSLAESFGGRGGAGSYGKEAEALNQLELNIMDDQLRRLEDMAVNAGEARRNRLAEAFGTAGDVEDNRVHRVGSELDVRGRTARDKSSIVAAIGPEAVRLAAEGRAALVTGDLKAAEAAAMEMADDEMKEALKNAKSDEERRQIMGTIFGVVGGGAGAYFGGPAGAFAGYGIGKEVGHFFDDIF